MATTLQIKGLKELGKLLTELPDKMESTIVREGLRSAAKEVQVLARLKAPKDSGIMAAGIKIGSSYRRGKAVARLRTLGKHGYLANWIEYGTAAHEIWAKKKKYLFIRANGTMILHVTHPGSRMMPFMRPAMEEGARKAVDAAVAAIRARFTKMGIAIPYSPESEESEL